MCEPRDHSEHTAQIIDEEVARILREADDRAFRLLEDHRDELERLTEALIEREVLAVAEIEELIGKRATGQNGPCRECPTKRSLPRLDNPEPDTASGLESKPHRRELSRVPALSR